MLTLGKPIIQIQTVEQLQEAVQAHDKICVRGGGSKPALWTPAEDTTLLDLSALRGVSVYEPGEYTFSAQAATPLAEVQAMLAEKGQYMPFDPPLAEEGATLGGTVAAGISGPGRYRYGSVRDFLIGIRFVDGRGEVARGGGNVVKNAAGFDFPKLMVGSLGRLGILTEVTFKVFPAPPSAASLCATFADLNPAIDALIRLTQSKLDIDALDLAPVAEGVSLWVRLRGLAAALPDRLTRLSGLLTSANPPLQIDLYQQDESPAYWSEMNRLSWRREEGALVKVALTPNRIRTLDAEMAAHNATRRYSAGGNTAWIAWTQPLTELDTILMRHELGGLCLFAPHTRPWLGHLPARTLLQRVASTLDPQAKFGLFDAYPAGDKVKGNGGN